MIKYLGDGKILTVTNASGSTYSAGGPVLCGARYRIPINDIANGASGPAHAEGVFGLAATTADSWADGAVLYWDPATSKLTNVAGSLTQIGTAVGAKVATTQTWAQVKLLV